MSVIQSFYGTNQLGEALHRFTCTNCHGNSIELIDYGATVVAVNMPDRHGQRENITLGCDRIEAYESNTCYFGSTVGRVCNRIAEGKFSIDGVTHQLATNDGPNHLHGGLNGFDKRVWASEAIEESGSSGLRLSLHSPCGDEGYPGNLSVVAEYRLNDDNELSIEFTATTDRATHVNLTNHNYWNLSGQGESTVYQHRLQINASHYLLNDSTNIPTGDRQPVDSSVFDFTNPKPIGQDLPMLTNRPIGYDHCYEIGNPEAGLRHAATVFEPRTHRQMEILTTQPGVQFYTGNYLTGDAETGYFGQHAGFCLETQAFPNAANQTNFATTLLEPGNRYYHKTVHRFTVIA